jgi:hypothetical protein
MTNDKHIIVPKPGELLKQLGASDELVADALTRLDRDASPDWLRRSPGDPQERFRREYMGSFPPPVDPPSQWEMGIDWDNTVQAAPFTKQMLKQGLELMAGNDRTVMTEGGPVHLPLAQEVPRPDITYSRVTRRIRIVDTDESG